MQKQHFHSLSGKICVLLGWAVLLSLPMLARGSAGDARHLSFYHTHTKESLEVTYYRGGEYLPDAMHKLRVFLADWRDRQQKDMDPKLMDILWEIQQLSGHEATFEVISAYRSQATNDLLRGRSSGVARNSQHLLGKAIDIRLRGLDLEELHRTARALGLGGVGYYPGSNFIHVDTARVRYW